MSKYTQEYWASLSPHQVGNVVEGFVEAVLREWNKKAAFTFHRLPDTKASRNMIQAQPADYMYRCGNYAGFIEVKGLGHPYRLPKGNLTQLPILQKWCLAGSDDVVLVYHYYQNEWRAIDPRLLKTSVPSHDLREFPAHATAELALKSRGYFG